IILGDVMILPFFGSILEALQEFVEEVKVHVRLQVLNQALGTCAHISLPQNLLAIAIADIEYRTLVTAWITECFTSNLLQPTRTLEQIHHGMIHVTVVIYWGVVRAT